MKGFREFARVFEKIPGQADVSGLTSGPSRGTKGAITQYQNAPSTPSDLTDNPSKTLFVRSPKGSRLMPRRTKHEPYVQIKVNLPATLNALLEQAMWDPVLNKPRYGERSELIALLVTKHLESLGYRTSGVE